MMREPVTSAPLPRITVVTPTLNHARFLESTIRSVLDQGYPDLEYWVIDGGSTDGTLAILERHAGALRWVSESDRGQADAINKGLARATGAVVGWLNSDDTYLEGALERVGSFLAAHPDVDVLYGEAYYVDREGEVVRPYPTREFDYEALAHHCYVCQPSVFFRRRVLDDVGLLDPKLRVALDYDFWIRLFRRHVPARLDAYLATSRMYSDNKTLALRPLAYREIIRTVRRHYGYVPFSWSLGRMSYLRHRNDQFHDPRRTTAGVFAMAVVAMAWYNRSNLRYFCRWLLDPAKGFRAEAFRGRVPRTDGASTGPRGVA
jgi:glycosyltransferase involved in cell wall biosynthesis